MKTSLTRPLLPASILALMTPAAMATVILADNFDHYATGAAPFGSKWTTGMSGDSTKAWVSGGAPTNPNNGPQTSREIVNAPDRTGNAFHYTESGDSSNFPYIYHDLAEPHTNGTWQMTLDFRVDELNNTGAYWLGGVYGATGRSTSALLAHAHIRKVTPVGDDPYLQLRLAYRTEAEGGGTTAYHNLTINQNTWYTLVITGNHETQTLSYSVAGVEGMTGYYQNDYHQIATVLLGDGQGSFTAPRSSAYLDNFELRAIPEASTAALLIPSAVLMGYGIRSYRNRR